MAGPLGGVSKKKGARIKKPNRAVPPASGPVVPLGGVAPQPAKKKERPGRRTTKTAGPLGGVSKVPGSKIGAPIVVDAASVDPAKVRAESEARRAAAQERSERAAAAEAANTSETGDESTDGETEAVSVEVKPDGLSANQSEAWDLVQAGGDDDTIAAAVGVKSATVAKWRAAWEATE